MYVCVCMCVVNCSSTAGYDTEKSDCHTIHSELGRSDRLIQSFCDTPTISFLILTFVTDSTSNVDKRYGKRL